jgi:hypothetical protein
VALPHFGAIRDWSFTSVLSDKTPILMIRISLIAGAGLSSPADGRSGLTFPMIMLNSTLPIASSKARRSRSNGSRAQIIPQAMARRRGTPLYVFYFRDEADVLLS